MRTAVTALLAVLLLSACRRPGPAGHQDRSEPAPEESRADASPPPATPDPGGPSRDGEPIEAGDMARVDPLELLGQAKDIAQRIEPRAELVYITQRGPLVGGTTDLTRDGLITYELEYRYLDPSRPPGADKVEGRIAVTARDRRFRVSTIPHTFRPPGEPGRPDPKCRVRDAWSAVVASGVPSNAVATVMYGWGGRQPFTWLFTVDGHPELRREVDGQTCQIAGGSRSASAGRGEVVDPWRKPAATASPPVPPAPPAAKSKDKDKDKDKEGDRKSSKKAR